MFERNDPMQPSHPIEEILGAAGPLATALRDFEYRSSQVQMAGLIDQAIKARVPAMVEAGTGTGKTLGYLVPLVQSGRKAVISTGTKNLQEQIYHKDIPLLAAATGIKIHAVMMKGRKNYLCLHRYHQFFSQPSFLQPEPEKLRKKIEKWLRKTEHADFSELTWMREDDPLRDALSSGSDQCLGSTCLHMADCYLNELRRRAAQAQLVIVNHHLFFADLMVKREGFGEIIPRFQVVVFDEAHDIEEIATTYLGESLSTYQFMELADDLEKEMRAGGKRDKNPFQKQGNAIRVAAQSLRGLFNDKADKGRLGEEALRLIREGPGLILREALQGITGSPPLGEAKDRAMMYFITRAEDLKERLEGIFSHPDPKWLVWYEKRKKSLVLHASPLDIAEGMQELLYQKRITMIFASATLSTNNNFHFIRSRLGLVQDILEGIYPSHFDFSRQTLMYLPRDLPLPSEPDFGQMAAQRIAEILNLTQGRALVLFTSHHNLNLVYLLLKNKIPYPIHKQGDAPRSLLLDEFKKDTNSVLMATGSFWQGVDVPGEALSCLIIDKLPFDSPGEPLVAARIELCQKNGGNPFMEYQLPSAIIALKQGFGRLIRNRSDRGILSILDKRIMNSRYGRFFLESLPDIPISHELADIQRFF